MSKVLTQQEIYDMLITEVQARTEALTDDSEGSMVDVIMGATSTVASQLSRMILTEFAKTFFDSAGGPEETGGPDDLETLAVDHFGSDFARPEATKATGEVTFSRPTADEGEVTIPEGTVLATDANANGEKQRFVTVADVTMGAIALSVAAEVEAQDAGIAGNVLADKIVNIESTLTDSSIVVTNDDAMSGGAEVEDDAEYRETIRELLQSLKGATLAAIESKAKSVPGVTFATAIERMIPVIQYDIGGEAIEAGAEYFRLPYAYVYIADANGVSSDSLIESVQEAVDTVRAAGVKVEVKGAVAVELDWSAEVTLDPGGPNFSEFSSNPQAIVDAMEEYIRELPVGTSFVRSTARTAILAIYGPSGTGDLTDFDTVTPVGDVSVSETQKLIPDEVEIV